MIRKDIQTRQLADGTILTIPVFFFQGSDPSAPSVYIQSGIHGSEIQGYLVCLYLLDALAKDPPKGNVTIVPMANPYGTNYKCGEYTQGRFDPVTGENWNRNYSDLSPLVDCFLEENKNKSFSELVPLFKEHMKKHVDELLKKDVNYAHKIALQLQFLSVEADIVLDLHCDTFSVPHVYANQAALSSVQKLGFPFVIHIPDTFGGALDEASFYPWHLLTKAYNGHQGANHPSPVEAFTLELGHQESIHADEAFSYAQKILTYLSKKGAVKEVQDQTPKNDIFVCLLENFKTIHAPRGGIITKTASLGLPLPSGETLLSINTLAHTSFTDRERDLPTSKEIFMHLPLFLNEDAIPLTRCVSPIVHEGMALMKVMTLYTVLS